VASDSQITDLCTGTFDTVQKIRGIESKFSRLLIIQCGLWPFTNRVIDIMQEKVQRLDNTSPEVIKRLIEDCIREAKAPLDEEQQIFVNSNPSQIIAAFYSEKTPYLCRFETHGVGIGVDSSQHFITGGCGAFLSDYLLSEYLTTEAPIDVAVALAIYAIKKVKDRTKFCGGDTVVKLLFPIFMGQLQFQYVARWQPIDKQIIALAESELDAADKKTRTLRRLEFNSIITAVAERIHSQREENRNDRPHQ
jgi:20S proteasome alpha/beta subunit